MLIHRPRRLAVLALAVAAGCAGAPPPPATPPPEAAPTAAAAAPVAGGAELPPLLRGLDLTPAQMEEALRINADLENATQPVTSAAIAFGRSVAGAARGCKGASPFMETDAERVVREGEEVRGTVLDAVQRVHRLLTPAQRRKVSDRLVEGDDKAKRERRNSSRTRELGPALDLSAMQIMSMLMKAGVLWTTFADRIEPWRVQYHTAIVDFARDDFDVHREPVATAPAVQIMLDFVQTGLRMLVPLLEPKQCEALGHLIDDRLDQQEAFAAEKAAARERAAEHR